MLRALAASCDAEAEALAIAPDRLDPLREALASGLAADVLLITGGVSAGNRDLVPEALASLGVDRVFHKVRIKPGKPLWFGVGPPRDARPGALVFGLPGNPVSGVVGFLLFVRPALDRLWARTASRPYLGRGRLAAPFAHSGDRPTYHPSRLVPRADRPGESRGRTARLGGLGRPEDGGAGRRVRGLPGGRSRVRGGGDGRFLALGLTLDDPDSTEVEAGPYL